MEVSEDTEGGSSSSEEEVEVERKSQETESDPESEEHEPLPPAQVAKRKADPHNPPAAKRTKKNQGIKGAMSAYLIYWKEVQANLKAENPSLVHMDLAKLCGHNWKALSAEEKQPYIDKAAVDKSRYASERAAGGDDPEDNKRPRKTGYVLFCKAERRDLKREHPDITPNECRKMLSEKWKALSPEEKRSFNGQNGKQGKTGGLTDQIDDLVALLRKKVEARMLRPDIGFLEMKGLLEIVCQKSNYDLLRRLEAFPSTPSD